MRSSRPADRAPRGYALMLALMLTATVLGASALMLGRVKQTRAHAQSDLRTTLVRSALESGRRHVVAMEQARADALARGAAAPPDVPLKLQVGAVEVTADVPVRAADGSARRVLRGWLKSVRRDLAVCTVPPGPPAGEGSGTCVPLAAPPPDALPAAVGDAASPASAAPTAPAAGGAAGR